MNNQKAIKILGQYDVSDLHFYTTEGEEIPFTEWSDAVEMAISALRVQDVPDTDRDMISRKLMSDLGATCIARRDDDGGLIVLGRIDMLPSVQPERQTGKWIVDEKRFGDNEYHCNQCGAVLEGDALIWRNNYYCYHCGAEMRGKQDG